MPPAPEDDGLFFGLVLARAARRSAHAWFRSAEADPLPEPEARLDPFARLDTPAPAFSPLAGVSSLDSSLPFDPFLLEVFVFDDFDDFFVVAPSSASSLLALAAAARAAWASSV